MKVRSDKGFAIIVRFVFWSLCVGCAVAVLKKFEGKEILKNNFSRVGEVEALLQALVCAWARVGLQMCLRLWVGYEFIMTFLLRFFLTNLHVHGNWAFSCRVHSKIQVND